MTTAIAPLIILWLMFGGKRPRPSGPSPATAPAATAATTTAAAQAAQQAAAATALANQTGNPAHVQQAAQATANAANLALLSAAKTAKAAATPAPWPQFVPKDLPAFPGPEWVPYQPPPKAVIIRAQQLLGQLWKNGKGTYVIEYEKSATRWVAYQAQWHGQKKGVTAYRTKK